MKEEEKEDNIETLYPTNEGYKTLKEILFGTGYIDIIWGPDIVEEEKINENPHQ